MAIDRIFEQKSAHRLAYDHYLRTGQRLTSAQWLERTERKFNPYHDELGRFTSAPGVTVSWGAQERQRHSGAGRSANAHNAALREVPSAVTKLPTQASRPSRRRGRPGASPSPVVQGKLPGIAQQQSERNSSTRPRLLDGLTTEFVSNAAIPGDHASSYFDLRIRQANLDAFRAAQDHPSDAVLKDLDEIQRRNNANERLLNYRYGLADQQVLEIGRAGAAPVDIITGGIKIARGDAELRDYFSVGSVVPVTAVLRYVRGVPQIAGSRSLVTSIIRDLKLTGFDRHHNWAKAAMESAGLRLPPDMIPITVLIRPDHMSTGSWGNSFSAIRYRAHQSKLLEQGRLSEAAIMDVKNIDDVTGGGYSHASEEMLRFVREVEKKIGR